MKDPGKLGAAEQRPSHTSGLSWPDNGLNDIEACCKVSYGHPLARWLMGDSFHPGGLRLTSRLASLLGIESGDNVLDPGSGLGASAVHIASSTGCRVTGITLEAEGIEAGNELARRRGVADSVTFLQGDLNHIDVDTTEFEFVLMECVLSIMAHKAKTLRRLGGLLAPGGRLGMTDVTVSGPLAAELRGVLANVGCVGGALSLDGYRALLNDAGFTVEYYEDLHEEASEFLNKIAGKLAVAEMFAKLQQPPIGGELIAQGKRLLASAQDVVRRGVLGYGLLVARKS